MKLISIVSPCYNEEGNVKVLTERVRELMSEMPQYRYEHIVIDNNSTDNTVAELREIAACDKNLKVIVNARNFGHIRSPHHARKGEQLVREGRRNGPVAVDADRSGHSTSTAGGRGPWRRCRTRRRRGPWRRRSGCRP